MLRRYQIQDGRQKSITVWIDTERPIRPGSMIRLATDPSVAWRVITATSAPSTGPDVRELVED